MDQKRLFVAIAVSIAILLAWQYFEPAAPPPAHAPAGQGQVQAPTAAPGGAPAVAAAPKTAAVPKVVPRIQIDAPRVSGSISLLGAEIDDVVLRDYHRTIAPASPLVRLLDARASSKPYFIQFGWTAPAGSSVRVPDDTTLWQGSGTVSPGRPVTLSWNNGEGLTFRLIVGIDANYMFSVRQEVVNDTGAAVSLYPWSRIRRAYEPKVLGYYILHEGPVGVLGGTLHEQKYAATKSAGEKANGVGYTYTGADGWAGFTDKYWLTALVPERQAKMVAAYRYQPANGHDGYQVDFVTAAPETVAPHATAGFSSRAFVGAKVVDLLERYESADHILLFSYAVDFGWFWFFTKPIFFALDWLNALLGNFGLAIIVFTIGIKAAFFPLANKSYRSMSKMKLLGPKMAELKEQYKDDAAKLQQSMMALYKAEKVNPASGCLPMIIQIPVFFSLYKVIFITIEMRHAPFFGWIHDLSAVDPTNVFNLFGLLPFDPGTFSPFLHLGAWPLIMGFSMYFQQKLNPAPPDPVQAKMFQWMPVIFTFMLANFPAGLVIYWTCNNVLTIAQQWFIMRQTRLDKPRLART